MENINNTGVISSQDLENNTDTNTLLFNSGFKAPDISKPLYVYISCEFHTESGEILYFNDIIIDRRYRLKKTQFDSLDKQLGIDNISGEFKNIKYGNKASSEEYVFQEQSKVLTNILKINCNQENKFH